MKRRLLSFAAGAALTLTVMGTGMCADAKAGESLELRGDKFYYMVDGVNDTQKYGFVKFDGGSFLVANGTVATHINGLAQDPGNPANWYYLSNGQVQNQYTGLAMYDNAWFYVSEGRLDTTVNQIVEYDEGYFLVAAGQIKKEVNGLVQDPQDPEWWYFVAEGQVQTQYSGLALYDGQWFYVKSGVFQNDYTGYVNYQGEPFYVVNGQMVKNASQMTLYTKGIYNSQNYSNQLSQVLGYVNSYRAEVGRDALVLDPELCVAACMRAQEMADTGIFSHTRPNGQSCFSIFKEMCIEAGYKGENIAYGYRTPAAVCNGWYHSEGHYANMIQSDFTRIGVGLAYSASGRPYWVQLFADQ